MQFSRVGEHTIRCVISEQEIGDLGFSLEDIMSNSERTQQFMNHIFDMAEREFQTKFDLGIKTVRAEFLPDHTVALTFSEHMDAGAMMEHLKDLVNGLLNTIPKEKWPKQIPQTASMPKPAGQQEPADVCVIVLIAFEGMDTVERFAKQVSMEVIPESMLFKHKNRFWLVMDLSDETEAEVQRLSALADEYAVDVCVGAERRAYMLEHADCILRECAIEQLQLL